MQRFAAVFAAQPIASSLVFGIMAVLAGLAMLEMWRGRSARAFWCVVGILLVGLVVGFGEDIDHHVYRIVALAGQLSSGQPSLLLVNPTTGETLPTFVYYSFVPYLPAVVLNLAGVPAHAALKIVMGAELLVMAWGLRHLVERVSPDADAENAGYLVALLFLCVNYVYGLWLQRMAFAEIWVYCLIPWVVLALVRANALLPLVALLFLQIVGHPIVFAQAFICSLLVAWGLSIDPAREILRRSAVATAAALVLAAPFWLPPLMWQALILGPAGLPVRFADTFLSPAEVVDRRFMHGVGFALPLAIVLMVVLTRARLSRRAWALVAAFAAALAIQTTTLRPLAERLPLLSTSLFVWRLMFPAAVLGLGALWAGWRPRRDGDLALTGVATLSLLSMLVVLAGGAPAGLALAAESRTDETWYRTYLADSLVWGRKEFLPNYAAVPQKCDVAPTDTQSASFAELQQGVSARSAYVAASSAPLGGIDYSVDGIAAPIAACGDRAVLGPLKTGAVVKASQPTLTLLLYARIACLLVCALGFLALGRLGSRPWRTR